MSEIIAFWHIPAFPPGTRERPLAEYYSLSKNRNKAPTTGGYVPKGVIR